MNSRAIWMMALGATGSFPALGRQFVYPAKEQSPQQQQAAFAKARAVCLEGRGYTVK